MILRGSISKNFGRQALSTCLDCGPPQSLPKLSSLLCLLHPLRYVEVCAFTVALLWTLAVFIMARTAEARRLCAEMEQGLCLFPSTTPMIWLHGVAKGHNVCRVFGSPLCSTPELHGLIDPQVWKDAFSVTDSSAPRAGTDPDICWASQTPFSISENFLHRL